MLRTGTIEFNIDFCKITYNAQKLIDIIVYESSFNEREYFQYLGQLDFLDYAGVIDSSTYGELCQILMEKRMVFE